MNLARLNQGECFKEFVDVPNPPGKMMNRIAVFTTSSCAQEVYLNFKETVR